MSRPRNERTFGELCEWWLHYARNRKKSWKTDRNLGPLMNRRLSTITKGDLRQLHADITEKGEMKAFFDALEAEGSQDFR